VFQSGHVVTERELLANGEQHQPMAAGALLPLLTNLTEALVDHLDDGQDLSSAAFRSSDQLTSVGGRIEANPKSARLYRAMLPVRSAFTFGRLGSGGLGR
jgi:hypothetical protein